MATKGEIARAIAKLEAAFPKWDPPQKTVQVYSEFMADMESTLLLAVISHVVSTCTFAPSIAEIREAYARFSAPGRPSAQEAWGLVLEVVHRCGSYGEPTWEDPVLAKAVASVGYATICMAEPEQQVCNRAQFVRAYEAIAKREQTERQYLPEARTAALLDTGIETRRLIGDVGKDIGRVK